MSTITKPVFLVGCGRSGTTLIYDLLAYHPDFAWFSNWTTRFPQISPLAILNRLPIERSNVFHKFKPVPAQEGIKIYRHCGIEDIKPKDGNPIGPNDVPTSSKECLRKLISAHQYYQGKTRFLHKNTANSLRIPFLHSLFPDAKFIHIIRDGRAVALSLSKVKFWQNLELWWSDETPRTWAEKGNDPVMLAGLHWQREVNAVLRSLEAVPDEQQFGVRYEDFVASPKSAMRDLVQFCELEWTSALETVIDSRKIGNFNNRWSSSTTESSMNELWESIRLTSEQLGYSQTV